MEQSRQSDRDNVTANKEPLECQFEYVSFTSQRPIPIVTRDIQMNLSICRMYLIDESHLFATKEAAEIDTHSSYVFPVARGIVP